MLIAILIVGKIKSYSKKQLSNIKYCYDLNNDNTDIFIFNNISETINNRIHDNLDNIKICKTIMRNKKHINNCNDIINNISDTIKDNYIKFKNLNIHNKELDTHNKPMKHSFHQHYQIYEGLKLIKQYEIDNNIRYDYIMKIRLDCYLENDKFGPYHYFNNNDDILFKSYKTLKNNHIKVSQLDDKHDIYRTQNINNTTKTLCGQYISNEKSFDIIKDITDKNKFNDIITQQFVILINDFCYFASASNFNKLYDNLIVKYGEYYTDKSIYYWTAESQLQQCILDTGLYYLDYNHKGIKFKGYDI